jgi:hypothetical protein
MKKFSKYLAEKNEQTNNNMLGEILSIVKLVYDIYPQEVMNFLEKVTIKEPKIRDRFREIKDIYNFSNQNQPPKNTDKSMEKLAHNASDEKDYSDLEQFGNN